MIDVKANFKNMYINNLECSLCGECDLQTQNHLLVCSTSKKQDQGSKAPSTSPFSQLKIEPSLYSKHFVSIPRVLELLKS